MCDGNNFLNLAALSDAFKDFRLKLKEKGVTINKYDILNGLGKDRCDSESEFNEEFQKETKLPLSYILFRKYYTKVFSDINNTDNLIKSISINTITGKSAYFVKLLYTDVRLPSGEEERITNISNKRFREKLKINGKELLLNFFKKIPIFLLDCDTIGISKLFEDANVKYSRIINREVINDSAPKTLSNLEHQYIYLDTDKDIKTYDKTSNFNTKYKISLTKPDRYYRTIFKIDDDSKTIFSTNNQKKDNTIDKCASRIKNASKNDKPAIYQIKRSGDWLQGLSCLDSSREYNNGRDSIKGKNVVLITHDIILLCYCLYMNINVVFTNAVTKTYKELYYFRRKLPKDIAIVPSTIINPEVIPEVVAQEKIIPNVVNPPDLTTGSPYGFISSKSPVISTEKYLSEENSIELVRIQNDLDENMRLGISESVAKEIALEKLRENPGLFSRLHKEFESKHKWIDKNKLKDILMNKKGGNRNSVNTCNSYLTELCSDIEAFDDDKDSDYYFYENVAFIILACLNEYKASSDVYEIMQAIIFDILPSVQGYIRTEESDIIQFFKDDKYTADCTAFAARNVALHSLGLWSGPIESLGNREKHSVKIPPSAVEYFDKIKKHLETSEFDERRDFLVEQLKQYHSQPVSKPRVNSKSKTRSVRMTPQPRMVTVSGGRKHVTRRKRN